MLDTLGSWFPEDRDRCSHGADDGESVSEHRTSKVDHSPTHPKGGNGFVSMNGGLEAMKC